MNISVIINMDVDLQTLMALIAAARGSAVSSQHSTFLQNLSSFNPTGGGSLSIEHPTVAQGFRKLELRGPKSGGGSPSDTQAPPTKTSKGSVGAIATSTNLSEDKKKNIRFRGFVLTIETIVISALIFIAILAWFEVIRVWYVTTFETADPNYNIIYFRFFYALSITFFIAILLYVIYRMFAKLHSAEE